ncbi:MAG TPA: hypothetical protein VF596_08600 [Pyrinomonadaceae bacterium]|jgi:hypothetical protein
MNKTIEWLLEKLEKKFEAIKEYFHWTLMIAPIFSAFLAKYFGHIEKPIEIALVIISLLLNFFLLWLWSYYEYQKTKELRLFKTFFLGKLPPPKKGGELLINTEIAVIEDKSNVYFYEKLEEKFKTELIKNTLKRVPIKDDNLKFRGIVCESYDQSKLDAHKKIEKENQLKNKLENDISKSKVVVVVRTKALDEKPWVYEAVESWANKNSDSPCLFIKNKSESYDANKIADNYRWIYDDPKILPWKLLQRAKHRSHAWRIQASFNKAMVTNLFALLIMIFLIAIFVINELENDIKTRHEKISPIFQQQQDNIYGELEDLYKTEEYLTKNIAQNNSLLDENHKKIKERWKIITKQTKDEYKALYTNLDSRQEVDISYWFRDDNNARAFTTTEKQPEIDHYAMEGESQIVCVFNNPNHYAIWQSSKNYISPLFFSDQENETLVFDFEDKKQAIKNCTTLPRKSKPIGAITCISYNRYKENNEKYTVGICAFSRNIDKSIFIEGFNKFLENRVREFDKYIHYLLEKDKIKSLITENNKISPLIANEN